VSRPRSYVGLDVGGTQVKGGFIRADELAASGGAPDVGELIPRTRAIDTLAERGGQDLLDRLIDFAHELTDDVPWPEVALGVGVPGIFDPRSGILVRSANLRAVEGLDLVRALRGRMGREQLVVVDNDANLAAVGESWLGAGRGLDDLLLITLGTGIGGGAIIGGQPYHGPTGRGGEIGHTVVRSLAHGESEDPDLRCGCGAYGCLERLASATAASRRARAAGLTDDLAELARCADAAPGPERELLHAVGRDLGAGLLAVDALLDVATVVIGGGFGRALKMLRPGIEEVFEERDYGGAGLRLLAAELGASAGWIGAARSVILAGA